MQTNIQFTVHRMAILITCLLLPIFCFGQISCAQCDGPICTQDPKEEMEEEKSMLWNLKKIKQQWAEHSTNRDFGNLGGLGPFSGDTIQGTLIWPLKPSADFDDFSYFYISQYQDLDTASGSLLDYNCGTMTYDSDSGYDHDGIDIVTFPYPYHKIADSEVNVVAAADGIILCKLGGNNPDDNCKQGTGRPRNRIILVHFDGTITQYGHLKTGSFTSKNELDTVSAGEYLAQVGSSGNSSIPHLHFEIKDSNLNDVDPNFGPCSDDTNLEVETTTSWWADQLNYKHPFLNALYTHDGTPTLWDCDLGDSTGIPGVKKLKTYFEAGDSIVFGSYYRHVEDDMTAVARVYRPDNTLWKTWNDDDDFTNAFSKRKSLLRAEQLAFNAMDGTWRYEVTFEGDVFEKLFYVSSCAPNKVLSGVVDDPYFNKANLQITTTQRFINNGQTDALLQAGNALEMNIGFEVNLGAKFETRIADCDDPPEN